MRQKYGQSLLEYILLACLTIAVVVAFSGTFFEKLVGKDRKSGAFGNHFNNMYQRMGISSK
jgi:hypothetical protein